jgi:hypothetical protein
MGDGSEKPTCKLFRTHQNAIIVTSDDGRLVPHDTHSEREIFTGMYDRELVGLDRKESSLGQHAR